MPCSAPGISSAWRPCSNWAAPSWLAVASTTEGVPGESFDGRLPELFCVGEPPVGDGQENLDGPHVVDAELVVTVLEFTTGSFQCVLEASAVAGAQTRVRERPLSVRVLVRRGRRSRGGDRLVARLEEPVEAGRVVAREGAGAQRAPSLSFAMRHGPGIRGHAER
jgi:hypothetical protein